MNKKALIVLSIGIVFVLFILFLSSFVFAANNTSTTISNNATNDISTKAYNCLKNQINDKETLSLVDATFSALALGDYNNLLVKQIENNRHLTDDCWPRSGCKLKETALVALAYKGMNKDTAPIKNWILTRNATASDLNWFLEIDIPNKEKSNCRIKSDGVDVSLEIKEDMTVSSSSLGNCFVKAFDGFMLKINNNCLNKDFDISCNKDFATSLLYQKNSGGIIFVMPDTQSGSGSSDFSSKTTVSIGGKCLKSGATCDYEGTLWAALALQKLGFADKNSDFMPYLLAFKDEGINAKYFPSAFLYIIAGGGDDQYDLIMDLQKTDSRGSTFWEILGGNGKYYDTSLAMLSLGADSSEISSTIEYLTNIQGKDGCWGNTNIRDTAFLLYAGWPKPVSGGGGGKINPCISPFSCEKANDCLSVEDAIIEKAYDCNSISEVCCSVAVPEKTCSQKGGIVCEKGKECEGDSETSSSGPCCLSKNCIEKEEESTCADVEGTCKSKCGDGEETSSETCSTSSDVCCVEKQNPPEESSSSWLWIIILIILIILIVLAIIFRERLKLAWLKFSHKSENKSGPAIAGRLVPQTGMRPPQMPFVRPGIRPSPIQQRAPVRPQVKDKGMEDTLKKLRELGKK